MTKKQRALEIIERLKKEYVRAIHLPTKIKVQQPAAVPTKFPM